MTPDVVIIGAGPVGLACAIEIQRRGRSVVVVEKGALVNSLIGYPTQMEFFSTPELLEIGGHPFPVSAYKPHREDALDYYQRVAAAEKIPLRLYERVVGLRGEAGQFIVETSKGRVPRPLDPANPHGPREYEEVRAEMLTQAVVVATGFFDVPNPLGVEGEQQPHVSHYFKEPYPHVGQDVVVVGARNSAAKAALSLARAGARVALVVRGADLSESVKYWIRPDLLNRIKEGRIRAYFNTRVGAINARSVTLLPAADTDPVLEIPADFVYALTGYRPDYRLLVDQLALPLDEADPARPPRFDPATHESARPGVYLAGTVCGGLATSRWFIENGRHHAQLIAQALAEEPRAVREKTSLLS